jgi:hypothetical protein
MLLLPHSAALVPNAMPAASNAKITGPFYDRCNDKRVNLFLNTV